VRPSSVIAGASLIAALSSASADASAAPEPASSPVVQDVHRAPLPDMTLGYRQASPRPTVGWAILQLLPSPEIAVGRQRHIDVNGAVDASPTTAFGLRWQVTPLLWSFGVHRSQSRWRYFVVDPFARVSGSLELSATFEYIGGHVDRLLARPGLRAYLPLAQKGEYLSMSLGTSVYSYEGLRVAYDVGVYTLAGIVGLRITVAPAHAPLAGIATLNLRYF